ncbi:hypothetical protein HZA98_02575 [Candidatus Woesearchaeota archaeon]|nr:hypothetical protein [Candidatus Woesearchaeota archaeon]
MKWRLFVLFLFLVASFAFVYFHSFYTADSLTGHATGTGTVTLTQAGSAGMSLDDAIVSFGSGYYNSSCSLTYADVNSNMSRTCWINTTSYFSSEDVHLISNSGSTLLNLTLSLVNLTDAESFFCGSSQGCLYSNTSGILVQSLNSESSSCSGLTSNFELLANETLNQSLGVCDAFDFVDASDTVKVYIDFHVPKDASSGNKTLFLNYQAVSL